MKFKEKTANNMQITDICQIKQLMTEKDLIEKKINNLEEPIMGYMGDSNLLVANDGAEIATFNMGKDGKRVLKIVREIGG